MPGLLEESYNLPGLSVASSSSSVSRDSPSIFGVSLERGVAGIDGVGDMKRAAIGGRSSNDSYGDSAR